MLFKGWDFSYISEHWDALMAGSSPMTYRIVVTQGVSEEGEAFLVILVFLLAVLHLLIDNGLKNTAVHSVETLGESEED